MVALLVARLRNRRYQSAISIGGRAQQQQADVVVACLADVAVDVVVQRRVRVRARGQRQRA